MKGKNIHEAGVEQIKALDRTLVCVVCSLGLLKARSLDRTPVSSNEHITGASKLTGFVE